MASNAPHTAQSSFFICINKRRASDFNGKRNSDGQGFAVFGRVVKGMDVALKIQQLPNTAPYSSLPVKIKTIEKTTIF